MIDVEPEVDVLLLPHMSDHGCLPAVPVHGQINKVDLGNGQIDLKIIMHWLMIDHNMEQTL